MRVIISGGGTGGHIFPAIAIADALKKQVPQAEILFVGAKGRMEMEKIPFAGYPIEGLWISGFQRNQIFKNILLPLKIIVSLFSVWRIIKKMNPDIVIGVGGYASAMAVQVAIWKGIPVLIHEQNSFAGKTNQILSKKASKICVAFDQMDRFFPKEKIVETGNPIRTQIEESSFSKEEAIAFFKLDPNKKTLFVTGGSLGAGTINRSIAAAVNQFISNQIQVIWQVGKIHYEAFATLHNPIQGILVLPFVERMDMAYAAADLVVSRAGALTLSEIQVLSKASILIPSPNVAEDHQTVNARSMTEKGAAVFISDKEAQEKLGDRILQLLSSTDQLNQLGENAGALAKTRAADKIASLALQIIKNQSL